MLSEERPRSVKMIQYISKLISVLSPLDYIQTTHINGTSIDFLRGALFHQLSVIERTIETVKERVRTFLQGLKYTLPFSVLRFGDYAEVHNPHHITNSMNARTDPCIALLPKLNEEGSYIFLNSFF